MKFKNLIKTVFDKYTAIGFFLMGIYNIILIVIYFSRRDLMPSNISMLTVDAALLILFTLLGFAVELFRSFLHNSGISGRTEGKRHE